jgi:hypothetical protein
MDPQRPGIFWTWQDRQVEDETAVADALGDIASRGFGTVLVQPRGCRYAPDDRAFVASAASASRRARDLGLAFWLHLDPRSLASSLVRATGESAEYLVVAGTGERPTQEAPDGRWLDAEAPLREDGTFDVRIDHPRTRPYHVHSDGALALRPLRLERCLAYRRDAAGRVVVASVTDVTASARLFVNELTGYVEVFGRWEASARAGDWRVLALVAFASNYPDLAGGRTREYLGEVLDRYVAAGAVLDGLWWDEPGYCTSFDRTFPVDRGRLPWGASLAALHRQRTGREALDDVLYLLADTDDGLAGARREAYYRSVQEAVLSAQADLLDRARRRLGPHVRMGAHHTWHQNADDAINGSLDWWRGAAVLGAGFTDVGDADSVDDERQMAEVTAMAALAVALGRRTASREAYCNLWGVDYGGDAAVPGEVLDWWVDLQATLGTNWLAHTYGPTGYFERPPAWGPGYPDHPTWETMPDATARLARALELAEGRLPSADVAVVYPLGALYRLGSERANPLATGAHDLVAALLRAGFEVDVVSPEALRSEPVDRYAAVVYLHPFGAKPADLEDLARRRRAGASVAAAGLAPAAGAGYAGPEEWAAELGDLVASDVSAASAGAVASALAPHRPWRLPRGALATRTPLADGGVLLRLCPARFGVPFAGRLEAGGLALEVEACRGLLAVRLGATGEVKESLAPDGVRWRVEALEPGPGGGA